MTFAFVPNPMGNQGNSNPIITPDVKTFTLYLDCAPENRSVTRASDLYAYVNSELAKAYPGTTTFRQIKYDGPGLFLAGFLKAFDGGPRDISIDTRTAEGLVVVEALRARTKNVVSA